ncbi:MAG: SMAD/FHA domain-containing protein [Olpidium bornovanus]|uniref:SMAD/FHA domain-containing protein n=1 Tax=Olpidium bornovanus TaxID=278681 RepID=A0A8H8DKG7_9FUNG|nr:MAG: SMAD/FHA domain-containing protein [Olpidium bornovanus]
MGSGPRSGSGSGTAGDGQPFSDLGGEVEGPGARQSETAATAAAAVLEAPSGGVFSPSTPVNSRQDAPSAAAAAALAAEPAAGAAASSSSTSGPRKPRIRIVPHIENARSLHFEVIDREFDEGQVVKVGRYTEKLASTDRIAFKSKVVSRQHAEMWMTNGQFYVKDTKSSSGTFLNHVRLSPPNQESRPFALKDGDVIQLGVDYQGGTEGICRRCRWTCPRPSCRRCSLIGSRRSFLFRYIPLRENAIRGQPIVDGWEHRVSVRFAPAVARTLGSST